MLPDVLSVDDMKYHAFISYWYAYVVRITSNSVIFIHDFYKIFILPAGERLDYHNRLPYQALNRVWILFGLSWVSLLATTLQTAVENKLSHEVKQTDSVKQVFIIYPMTMHMVSFVCFVAAMLEIHGVFTSYINPYPSGLLPCHRGKRASDRTLEYIANIYHYQITTKYSKLRTMCIIVEG